MQLPQELIEDVINFLSDDHPTLKTCSLVATTWLSRSRYHLFNRVTLNSKRAERWCSTIRPGPDGASYLVRTLTLRQAREHRWLETKFLDRISPHFSSFQYVENLSIAWLDLGDFQPGSLALHFVQYGSSLRSLRLSYLSADYSALMAFLQLFPNLKDLMIHTPDLCDDDPPLRMSRTPPPFHGALTLLSFESTSSPFVSHLAGLDLRFSSISAFNCDFSSDFPLNSLLETSSSSLRHLELEYITFCTYFYSVPRVTPINLTSQLNALISPLGNAETFKMSQLGLSKKADPLPSYSPSYPRCLHITLHASASTLWPSQVYIGLNGRLSTPTSSKRWKDVVSSRGHGWC